MKHMQHDKHLELIIKYLSEKFEKDEEREVQEMIKSCNACQEDLVKLKAINTSIRHLEDGGVLELLEKNEELRKVFARPLTPKEIAPEEYKQAMEACDKGFHRALLARRGEVYSLGAKTIWRNLAFTLASILILGMLVGVYKIVMLQKEIESKEAYYKNILAENEQKNQSIIDKQRETVEELGKKVEKLSSQIEEKQGEEVDKLRHRLEKLLKPSSSVLSTQFLMIRSPEEVKDVREIKLQKDKLFLIFRINVVVEEKGYKTYSLVIADSKGKAVWTEDQVTEDENGNLNLLVERNFLKPGDYVLKIYGIDRGQRKEISQRRFRIVSSQ